MNKLPVILIIPHYNAPESLSRLLKQVGSAVDTIVIDNASDQKPRVPERVQYIQNQVNTGFAHAANQGAAEATTEYLLFANPDIEISPETITELVEHAQKHSLDAVSPLLVGEDGKAQWQYHQPLPSLESVIQEYTPLKKLAPTRTQIPIPSVLPGACLLIRREVLGALGGWDERFWLWWEDVDLSQRLNDQAYIFEVAQNIRVTHLGGESFSPLDETWKRAVFFHSLQLFAKKHWSSIEQKIIEKVVSRFASNVLYPADASLEASIVVPNMEESILETFLGKNLSTFDLLKEELIIVTSVALPTLWQWRKKYPAVIFIHLEQNIGFAHTVNIGFQRARGKQLITVNDDTILQDAWVSQMVKAVKKDVGSVSPLVVSPQDVVESLGVHVLPRGKAIPIQNDKSQLARNAFNAAAVLLNRSAIETVGLFDERFGSYLEDIDLGLRMTQAGYLHGIVPTVKVVHLKHQTSQKYPLRKAWQDVRNWWLVVVKNTSFSQGTLYALPILTERLRNISGFVKKFLNKK